MRPHWSRRAEYAQFPRLSPRSLGMCTAPRLSCIGARQRFEAEACTVLRAGACRHRCGCEIRKAMPLASQSFRRGRDFVEKAGSSLSLMPISRSRRPRSRAHKRPLPSLGPVNSAARPARSWKGAALPQFRYRLWGCHPFHVPLESSKRSHSPAPRRASRINQP